MTDAQLTQVAVEEWSQPLATAQMTQVAVEMWASALPGSVLAVMTQVALEEWAAALPPAAITAGQTAITINTG